MTTQRYRQHTRVTDHEVTDLKGLREKTYCNSSGTVLNQMEFCNKRVQAASGIVTEVMLSKSGNSGRVYDDSFTTKPAEPGFVQHN